MTFEIPKELQQQLARVSNLDEIAPKMINAATPIVVKSLQDSLTSHKQSGELVKSVKAYKAKKIRNGGYYGRVNFAGYDAKTKAPNAQKAMSLEYGSTKQSATPFLDGAMTKAESKATAIMQEVFNKGVDK